MVFQCLAASRARMSQLDSHNGYKSCLPDSIQSRRDRCCMTSEHDLDPLDREIIERAFDSAWRAIKDREAILDYDSDEEREGGWRCEMIGIARDNGLKDAETLRDLLLATMSPECD